MASTKTTVKEVELDLGRYELRRSGQRVKLEKKPMELLIFLVGRREQMVSREDIVKKLWRSSLFVDTERNVNNIVRKIRTALGDDAAKPRFIETVVGKGYRFIGPVRVIEAQYPPSDAGLSPRSRQENASEWNERLSLAVLPPMLLGKNVDDQGMCLGFADGLVSLLGNLRNVDVLPASAVMNLPLEAPPSEIALRLGIRFVVHGAIQFSKEQWHLSLEMFDSYLQGPRWTKRYSLDIARLCEQQSDIAGEIARSLNRQLDPVPPRPRYSRDAMAYAEFMRGYRLSGSSDPVTVEKAIHHITAAVSRDPAFALAHATLAQLCATRHFEFDPANTWLEKAGFHGKRSLEIEPELPEGHVARAFLAWGPSKNFQHLEAIEALRHALTLQKNLPHAYNRLGSILAHIGLLDDAVAMFERGRPYQPGKAVSHSVVQAYVWSQQYELARQELQAWRAENPNNKYAIYFSPQPAMMTEDWEEATALVNEGLQLLPEEPLIISLQGVLYALTGRVDQALECMARASSSPKTFGHAHHTYYQIACILAVTGQRETAFAWLERSVSSGFACWPFFRNDRCLQNLHGLAEFDLLVSSLQAKYPRHLGML